MANQKQNPLVIIGLIAVIIVALAFIVKLAMPKRYRPPVVDWTCEVCGYQFVKAFSPVQSKCPKCGKEEVVRSMYYKCEKCGNVFEAYRTKRPPLDVTKEGPEGILPDMMEGQIKKPDGKWVNEMSEEGMKLMEDLSCPKCGNKERPSLKYSLPSSWR